MIARGYSRYLVVWKKMKSVNQLQCKQHKKSLQLIFLLVNSENMGEGRENSEENSHW